VSVIDTASVAPGQRRRHVGEITTMRGIACLAIVTLHALPGWLRHQGYEHPAWADLRLLLTVGTPTFVFLSGFVLAYAYPRSVPRGFLANRVRYILLPYLAIAAVTATYAGRQDLASVSGRLVELLLGGWHGYFVLVVLQFYVLHLVWFRLVDRLGQRTLLVASAAVNVAYLAVFNFTSAPAGAGPFLEHLWGRGHWLWLPAWLFYFALAYRCGTDVEALRAGTRRYLGRLVAATVAVAVAAIAIRHLGVLGVTSKRVDMVVLASLTALTLFGAAGRLRRTPWLLEQISRHSFGIYLLHILVLGQLYPWTLGPLGAAALPVNIVAALVLSGLTVALVSRLPFGSYVVGRVLPPTPPATDRAVVPAGRRSGR
jgi:membrane-bound acyltransferase YfiQ involved in biofilm formation